MNKDSYLFHGYQVKFTSKEYLWHMINCMAFFKHHVADYEGTELQCVVVNWNWRQYTLGAIRPFTTY